MLENQKIVPSIATMKSFEHFLKTEYQVCFVMNFHISLIKDLVASAHQHGKKVIVHIDLIQGLASDEFGCEYLCQVLKADGVISTKGKILEAAKKNKRIAILRVFLIDSKSLEKGIALVNNVKPDYMEILPAIATEIIPYIQQNCSVALIGGGLVRTVKQVEDGLKAGMQAVSVTKEEIWYKK